MNYLNAMLHSSIGEEPWRAYVSEYRRNIRYKLMSKLTKSGDIFYVFYSQKGKSAYKEMLHADVVYSPSTFQRRLRDLKKVYGIKSWAVARLDG